MTKPNTKTPAEIEPLNEIEPLPPLLKDERFKMQMAMQLDALNMFDRHIIRSMAAHDVEIGVADLKAFRRHPWYDHHLRILRASQPARRARSREDMAELFEDIADMAVGAEQFGAASGALVNAAKVRGQMEHSEVGPTNIVISWGEPEGGKVVDQADVDGMDGADITLTR